MLERAFIGLNSDFLVGCNFVKCTLHVRKFSWSLAKYFFFQHWTFQILPTVKWGVIFCLIQPGVTVASKLYQIYSCYLVTFSKKLPSYRTKCENNYMHQHFSKTSGTKNYSKVEKIDTIGFNVPNFYLFIENSKEFRQIL